MELTIDYNEQMLNRYPEVIKSIREFQLLIRAQSLEVEEMHRELTKLLQNAYLDTADETKIAQWEDLLSITPLPQGEDDLETWLNDRKETILARLYNAEKLNEKSIEDIVKIFTGGTTTSYFKDGIVHVIIFPPKDNKSFKFENVERELRTKIPAHLAFQVSRNYFDWLQVNFFYTTWEEINDNFNTWQEVLYQYNPDTASLINT